MNTSLNFFYYGSILNFITFICIQFICQFFLKLVHRMEYRRKHLYIEWNIAEYIQQQKLQNMKFKSKFY